MRCGEERNVSTLTWMGETIASHRGKLSPYHQRTRFLSVCHVVTIVNAVYVTEPIQDPVAAVTYLALAISPITDFMGNREQSGRSYYNCTQATFRLEQPSSTTQCLERISTMMGE